ncbi:hypothetical protein [Microbacterium sp. LMI1-1-1.1]|uniref:hypothetical protein n=1 Tax=Microbacterium sp. LMI1-1-1.1 TaxID=3135223 RepID=UPI003465AAF5
MRLRTTSTQRTYRYVRLVLVGASVLLAVSVAVQFVVGGPLSSLSAAYYSPAGPVFVGSLFAVAAALVALSGRSLEQGLLDVAAVLALVVAVVPTTVDGDACPAGGRCVPPEVVPTVANNAVSVASVVVLGAVAAAILARVQGTASRGVAITIGVILALVVGGSLWAASSPQGFLLAAHTVAAVAFFALVGAVAALAARRPPSPGRRPRGVRVAYAVVAGGILLTLVLLLVALVLEGTAVVDLRGFPVVLVGEAAALLLFLVFWVVQTVELWDDVDPRLGPGIPAASSR